MTRRQRFLLMSVILMSSFAFLSLSRYVYIHMMEDFNFRYFFPASILSDKVHIHTETADDLASKVKILCFVTTMRGSEERSVAVNVTWLKRCTRHVFVTSHILSTFRDDEMLVLTNVPEGRNHLTAKTFAALNHFYKHELDKFDWFLKADDDVYIIVENLRLLLTQYSPDYPVYLGHHFKSVRIKTANGYMSGGGSYVLSRQALRILGQKGLPQNGGVCTPKEPDEDLEVGKCLEAVGVLPHRTVDVYGRETFHPWPLHYSIFSIRPTRYSVHPKKAGSSCCSQLTITFHYVTPKTIYTLDLLLYHIDVYGRHPDDVTLRQTLFKPEVENVPEDDDKLLSFLY